VYKIYTENEGCVVCRAVMDFGQISNSFQILWRVSFLYTKQCLRSAARIKTIYTNGRENN